MKALKVVGILVAIAAVAILAFALLKGGTGTLFERVAGILGSGSKTTILTSEAVIKKIESVSELTTTKETIQVVVQAEVGDFTNREKMIMVAKGMVQAGLDMSKINASAVTVSPDGKSITVALPPVKIFNPNIILSNNKEDTYVYSYTKSLLSDPTYDLQPQARAGRGCEDSGGCMQRRHPGPGKQGCSEGN